MSKKPASVSFENPAKHIVKVPLDSEVESSFLSYAYSVIYSRALPDARDGLKPVQRRILYGMFDSGHTNEKPHVKSARVVGHVMGIFHPHGDSAIYDAMVRLAQPFSLMVPLVDGHGNFGSMPGDSPAASRYTEAKLSKESMLLLGELREGTVLFKDNYDKTAKEPVVLPVRFPNWLINGGEGIAVGMATKMPPHNPGEIIKAAKYLLKYPDATTARLMKVVPGPDFPTAGIILGQDAIKEAYETGRGIFKIRGRYHVEPLGRGKNLIVFTELPYNVNAEKIIEQISKAINESKISGIVDIKDLTEKNGIRLIFETKAGINPEVLVYDLFKHSNLEVSFGVNNVVILDGTPQTIGLKKSLEVFLEFRAEIIRNRSQFQLDKKNSRLHLIEGLLKALVNIDEVIKIVRSSPDSEAAKNRLIKKFKVDEIQSEYVLSLQLRRLTKFDQLELEQEKKKIEEDILELTKILGDEETLKSVINKELDETLKVIDRERKSVIVEGDLAEHQEEQKQALTAAVEVPDEPCYINLHASGMLQRVNARKKISLRGKVDPIISQVETTTRGNFVLVTNKGLGFRVDSLHVSDAKKTSLKEVGVHTSETPILLGKSEPKDGDIGLGIGTKNGFVKIVNSSDYPLRSDEFTVITLEDSDEIIGGGWINSPSDLVFVSSDTSLLRFESSKVRPQGRLGGGVAGIRLAEGSDILSFSVIPESLLDNTLVVTSTGLSIKVSPLSEFPYKGRATGGVRSHAFKKGESSLVFSSVLPNPVILDESHSPIALPAKANRRDASGVDITRAPNVAGITE